ncbi:GHKL domain-containing protein [Pseudoalteromonas piscicida]|uniref:histidine kinase n=1 Tax=Pseudoalteromonas piscicida TaxID=43662 RepID=A0AAQ2EUM5_PSEO7|nr:MULTISPECIES: ATP-binding protein [Pseudoalteromonas]KJY88947.1 histidine kinase [Pseudoalteromonas piscicida]MDP4487411.1 ATP-binding protein [Pseudoalteromonas piscicida]TMN37932.1 GHKL domain-containing protein [Pseudoalteromonas piscicida]TMN41268.1 GHKL domain-containing protein [Pseudoalteromonas piscicida]TMN53385.1 GHKL domain-containing protein [Pseudoalteromonas piscicida]
MVNSSQISLKIRQGFILVFVLIIALPALFFSVGRAYYSSLVDATEKTLEAHLYSLISEVEFVSNGLEMPRSILAPELNRLNSDTYALVYQDNSLVWYSESAVNLSISPDFSENQAGASEFKRVEYNGVLFWQLSLTVILGNAEQSQQARFVLLKKNDALMELMSGFRNTLVNWMLVMGVVIAGLMAFGFVWNARPLQRLDKEIKEIEAGERDKITGLYPVELLTIKSDLNLLLESQKRQKERYRASLSDLAHALKTPLAVIKSSPLAKDADAQEQLDRINAMIEHQLKRAATGASDTWKKQTSVKPVLDSILNAMTKVYHDKHIQFSSECSEEVAFLGDKTDLMEILGNIIDNACKACGSLVDIKVSAPKKRLLIIEVEDDGPGIPEHRRSELLTRGARLDTYEAGHGVGMAIVSDLVKSYHGLMQIGTSQHGGAKFTIEFNHEKNN